MRTSSVKLLLALALFISLMIFGFIRRMHHDALPQLQTIQEKVHIATVLQRPLRLPSDLRLISDDKNFLESIHGPQFSLLFFGYRRCPSLCPSTLHKMHAILKGLPEGVPLHSYLISIDPRDTQADVQTFLDSIDPGIRAVTGPHNDIMRLSQLLNIYIANDDAATVEHVNHTGALVLIGPGGRLEALFSSTTNIDMIIEDLKVLMGSPHAFTSRTYQEKA